ncbi:MAG: PIG-L deacetylase family protein, partial [Halanaerobiales bacterium]
MIYYNFNNKEKSQNIDLLFPEWKGEKEKIVVFAPHDDDAMLGAGYILTAAQREGAECYIFIYCNGACGYSNPEQKDEIVDIRKEETVNAYGKLGIEEDHIIRFDYPDFSAYSRIGWKLPGKEKGNLEKTIRELRKIKATRVLIPNGYREHFDHKA